MSDTKKIFIKINTVIAMLDGFLQQEKEKTIETEYFNSPIQSRIDFVQQTKKEVECFFYNHG